MSLTGLEVFDETLHKTNIWLKEIEAVAGTDRREARRHLNGDQLPDADSRDLRGSLASSREQAGKNPLARRISCSDQCSSSEDETHRTRGCSTRANPHTLGPITGRHLIG